MFTTPLYTQVNIYVGQIPTSVTLFARKMWLSWIDIAKLLPQKLFLPPSPAYANTYGPPSIYSLSCGQMHDSILIDTAKLLIQLTN